MLNATTKSTAASVVSGTLKASGASSTRTSRTVAAWASPATGLLPPWRMFVAVRAIAPVAANPPNRPAPRLATPWPTSSWLGSCLVPSMPSATVAESNDSMAPKSATATAGCSSPTRVPNVARGSANGGSPRGIPPKAEPMVATPSGCVRVTNTVAATRATMGDGTLLANGIFGQSATIRRLAIPSAVVAGCAWAKRRKQLWKLLEERRAGRLREAEEVAPLAHEYDDRDACGEAQHHGLRDEADDAAEFGQPQQQEHRPGQQRHDLKSDQPVLGSDAEEEDRERAGRPCDLNARSTEQRDEQPGDERCVEALLRLGAGCDRERHGEG